MLKLDLPERVAAGHVNRVHNSHGWVGLEGLGPKQLNQRERPQSTVSNARNAAELHRAIAKRN